MTCPYSSPIGESGQKHTLQSARMDQEIRSHVRLGRGVSTVIACRPTRRGRWEKPDWT